MLLVTAPILGSYFLPSYSPQKVLQIEIRVSNLACSHAATTVWYLYTIWTILKCDWSQSACSLFCCSLMQHVKVNISEDLTSHWLLAHLCLYKLPFDSPSYKITLTEYTPYILNPWACKGGWWVGASTTKLFHLFFFPPICSLVCNRTVPA